MTNRKYPSDSLRLGAMLAAVGGFMDAYTYIARGGVFANAQTGNLVLLGVRAFEGDIRALHYLVPVLAFVLGVLITEVIRAYRHRFQHLHWRQAVLLVESAVLVLSAFAPQSCNDLVNAGISFACAMQVDSFRNFDGNPYATTMCTGNLRSGTEQWFLWLYKRDRAALHAGLGYFAVIVSFMLGAGIGALMTERFMEVTALFPAGMLLVSGAMMHWIPSAEKSK